MKQQRFRINRAIFVESFKEKITDFYEFHPKELGKGAYGTVYKAKQIKSENTWRAIKKINKRSIKSPTAFANEVEILKTLDHPNIIKIYETFEDELSVYLVTDLCEGGQLFDRLDSEGNFSEEVARQIFRQIAQAINYCHGRKIAHRDLKPQNFIFVQKKSMHLKLIDFGLSYRWNQDMREELVALKLNKLVGTSYYIAPEVIMGYYDQRCDIWSMGVILYILVTATPPFDGQNDQKILQSVRKQNYTFNIPQMQQISVELKDLIRNILLLPQKRLSLNQIFSHPWMLTSQNKQPLKITFSRLINFSKFSQLKVLAVTYIASMLSSKQIEKLGDLFKQIDLNHDGFLTVQELKIALENQKQKADLLELKKLLDSIDTDKNGRIDYTEFVASCLQNSVIYRQDNLKMVFRMLDKDDNGFVSAIELKENIQSLEPGEEISNNVVEDILKKCDMNGDGKIDYKQFLQNMQSN